MILLGVYAGWSARSADQVKVWRDSLTLWQHAVRITPDVPYVQNNLGEAFVQAGYIEEALVAYSIATEMRPDFADAFNNLGVAYFLKRDYRRGIEALRHAEELYRGGVEGQAVIADVHFNLGTAYRELGDTSAALDVFPKCHQRARDICGSPRGGRVDPAVRRGHAGGDGFARSRG